jgi:bifunctional oligoribonuclease and PAP phosphatase NrnA
MTSKNTGMQKISQSVETFCEGLKLGNRFLLASHVTPEGDAVGSVLAMDSLLRRLGKQTKIVCQDVIPERLSWLSNGRWNVVPDVSASEQFDCLVVADCPKIERIGTVGDLITPKTKIFNIDHHVSNTKFGHFNYVLPNAGACGEVIVDIFKELGVKINVEEATALYVSINTDTGSFKYSNTTMKSHEIVSQLIQIGIDIETINDQLYATYSLEKVRLYSILLGRIKTTSDGIIAWAGLTREDLKKTGGTYEDAEGFIDFLKYMKEVQFSFFLTEMDGEHRGKIRVSLRSRGQYDVAHVAVHFGGGGHRKAAGCEIKGTIEEVAQKILNEVKREYQSQSVNTDSQQ